MEQDVFVQFLTRIFQSFVDLFPKYSWWLAGIIGLTVVLMIPVNILVKLCFKKAEGNMALTRLRKSISSLMVFIVALGVLYLYQLLIPSEKNYDFLYVTEDIWTIGVSSMATWWLIKLIGEIGLAPILLKITEKSKTNKQVKELISKCGLDKNIVNSVLESLESVLKDRVADGSMTVDEFMEKNQSTITQQAALFLNAYNQVDKNQIANLATIITEIANTKHNISK